MPSTKTIVAGLVAAGVSAAVGYFIYRKLNPKNKCKVIFVVGGPGSGKGTQCKLITEKYGYSHLSAGDLLREERNTKSELADMINQILIDGKLVPSEITTTLLLNAMKKCENNKFLIDGFPRSQENMDCWEKLAPSTVEVQFLLELDCPESVMLARLLERGKTSGRNDDNEESIKKRFHTANAMSAPVIDHYRSTGQLRVVDSNRPPNDVFTDICVHIDSANWKH
jgi:UMP-CMP kinase